MQAGECKINAKKKCYKWHDFRDNTGKMNNQGDILYQFTTKKSLKAMLWNHDKEAPSEANSLEQKWSFVPVCVNDIGSMVGTASQSNRSDTRPYFHDASGGKSFLPLLPDKPMGYAFGLNNHNEIVGRVAGAVLWERQNLSDDSVKEQSPTWKIVDLNAALPPSTGCILHSAIRINDQGFILAIGTYNGLPQSFLLVPNKVNDRQGKDTKENH